MSLGYVVRPVADQDIDALADSMAEYAGADRGLDFLTDVYATFSLLASQPEIGWPSKLSNPHLQFARTFRVSDRFEEILIFYQPYGSRIEIIRVVHGARDLRTLFRKAGAFD